jgi:hypothetical protein
MSDPSIQDGRMSTEIDLGTAPVEAVEALLDAAVLAGATTASLGVGVSA